MTYEEFLKICGPYEYPDGVLSERWLTGGQGGGNCWDSEPSYYPIDTEKEPNLTGLDEILMEVSPNLTFLQYRLIEKLIEYDTKTYNEYYGNYTIYSLKTLKLKDLYDKLKEFGYV